MTSVNVTSRDPHSHYVTLTTDNYNQWIESELYDTRNHICYVVIYHIIYVGCQTICRQTDVPKDDVPTNSQIRQNFYELFYEII